MIYKFCQPVYYYYEVEANSLEQARDKTQYLEAGMEVDSSVGEWEDL